jgi:biopolymer transport protein ExbD
MKIRRRKRMLETTVELNITAFLNLMVILVPFLLITAVFSRMSVLELNLPALNAKEQVQEEIKLQLQLVLRAKSFDIQDANLGLIKRVAKEQDSTDWNSFTDMLVEIKTRFPQETHISLLLEPAVNYKTLIQVMDRVRFADVVEFGQVETVELFPDISIGDAPEILVPDNSVETVNTTAPEISGSEGTSL